MLDGAHTNGFSKQAKTLYIILGILDYLTEPIFDNNSNEQDGNEETARSELNNIFW